MRKLLFIAVLGVGCLVPTGNAQAVIQVKVQEAADAPCAGFEEENIVEVQLKDNLPMVVTPTTNLEYYWTAHHQEGTWTWRTNNNNRRMLLPFVGQYAIQARVLYITQGSISPYASFWSNQIQLMAQDCN